MTERTTVAGDYPTHCAATTPSDTAGASSTPHPDP